MNKKGTHISYPDLAIMAAAVVAIGYLLYQLAVGINYNWNWSVIPHYLLRYDPQEEQWVPNLLLQGFFTTIRLSIWSGILAIGIGTVMAFLRISGRLFHKLIARTYVELVRNTPPLVLVFIFYFFISDQIMTAIDLDGFVHDLPEQGRGIMSWLFAPPARFSGFVSATITLALYEGAYITEIVRSGIQSMEKGQWEACQALGLSWPQQMRHVILPQAVRRILPPLAGQMISTVKDSAIVSVISIQELTFQGMELMAATYLTFEIWITITVLYFILTFSCSMAVRRLEKRWQSALD